jgi:glycosyltransferase involved in cell wall biosynthesis
MLTAVVLTHNEETNLDRSLKSLKFCDQILIIDDNSTDSTLNIAKKYHSKIINHPLNGDFSSQRNFALSKITSGWVLFIDADEEVSQPLALEIITATTQSLYRGFLLYRVDTLWGRLQTHGDTNTSLVRLGLVGSGTWSGRVHETWNITGQIGSLKSILHHYPHPKISQFISEINYYSTLRAEELYFNHKRAKIVSVILYPAGKFIQLYLIKLGVLDGMPGLLSAMCMSFYSFLVRGKLYLLKKGIPKKHV